jgi:hypothetical protein
MADEFVFRSVGGEVLLVKLSKEAKKRLRPALFSFSYLMWFFGIFLSWRSEQPIGVLSLTAAFWASYFFYLVYPPKDQRSAPGCSLLERITRPDERNAAKRSR